MNPRSASGPGAPGPRAVGVTGGRAGRGAAQEPLTPADTHSHSSRQLLSVRHPRPMGTQRPARAPHLSLNVVPGLLQVVPGAVRVVVNELGHDAAHLLLQLQRREHGPRSACSKRATPSWVTCAQAASPPRPPLLKACCHPFQPLSWSSLGASTPDPSAVRVSHPCLTVSSALNST